MAVLTRTKDQASLLPTPGALRLGPDGKVSDLTLNHIRGVLSSVVGRLNGLLSLGTGAVGSWAGNLDAQVIEITAREANVDQAVPHGLGRVPVGYIVIRTNHASLLYDNGGGNWTDTTMYLRSTDGGSTFRVLIF